MTFLAKSNFGCGKRLKLSTIEHTICFSQANDAYVFVLPRQLRRTLFMEGMPPQLLTPEDFSTFGDLLKYLRRRQRLTQLEFSIASRLQRIADQPAGEEPTSARPDDNQSPLRPGTYTWKMNPNWLPGCLAWRNRHTRKKHPLPASHPIKAYCFSTKVTLTSSLGVRRSRHGWPIGSPRLGRIQPCASWRSWAHRAAESHRWSVRGWQ